MGYKSFNPNTSLPPITGVGAPGASTGNNRPNGTVYVDTAADAAYTLVDNTTDDNIWSGGGNVAGLGMWKKGANSIGFTDADSFDVNFPDRNAVTQIRLLASNPITGSVHFLAGDPDFPQTGYLIFSDDNNNNAIYKVLSHVIQSSIYWDFTVEFIQQTPGGGSWSPRPYTVTFISTGGGGTWGSIGGTLSDQPDLQDALNLKANTADLGTAAAAYTGNQDAGDIPILTAEGTLPITDLAGNVTTVYSDGFRSEGANVAGVFTDGSFSVIAFPDSIESRRLSNDARAGLYSTETGVSVFIDDATYSTEYTPTGITSTSPTFTIKGVSVANIPTADEKAALDGARVTNPPNAGNPYATAADVALAGGGDVSKVGTPVIGEVAIWTGTNTVQGLDEAEFKAQLNLEIGTDVAAEGHSVDAHPDVDISTDPVTEGEVLVWRTNKFVPEPAPGGVTDHGLLDPASLEDDDHQQYHNDTRGDARYFTQQQVTDGYAPIGHVNSTDGHPTAVGGGPGTETSGLLSGPDKTKLDTVAANADVTDTDNVTAAGAVMDSEVTSLAGVKAMTVSADGNDLTVETLTATKGFSVTESAAHPVAPAAGKGQLWVDLDGRLIFTSPSDATVAPGTDASLNRTFTTTADGLVPAPGPGNSALYLQGDGTWSDPAAGSGHGTGSVGQHGDVNLAGAAAGLGLIFDVDNTTLIVGSVGGTDADAIHDNVANEIAIITAKAVPVPNDFIIIEDSEAANVKKSTTLDDLPVSTPQATAIGVAQSAANAAQVDADQALLDAAAAQSTANAAIPATEKGAALGVATLDSNSRIPSSQLPVAALEFRGGWNATTNIPDLTETTYIGTAGDTYSVTVAGQQTLDGVNPIDYAAGDRLLWDGAGWIHEENTDEVGAQGDILAGIATTFGRSLIDDANATEARATLVLGDSATLNVGITAGTVAAGNHNHTGVYEPAGTVTTHESAASAHDSVNIDYDNTISGLAATNVKLAIDELEGLVGTGGGGGVNLGTWTKGADTIGITAAGQFDVNNATVLSVTEIRFNYADSTSLTHGNWMQQAVDGGGTGTLIFRDVDTPTNAIIYGVTAISDANAPAFYNFTVAYADQNGTNWDASQYAVIWIPGAGSVDSVVGGAGILVDNTNIANPVVRVGGSIYNEINANLTDGDLASFTFGAGDPLTLVITPEIENQFYFDTVGKGLWRDTGLAGTWEQIAGRSTDVTDGTITVTAATTIDFEDLEFAVTEPVAGTAGVALVAGSATAGVPNSKMRFMPAQSVKVNPAGAAALPQDVTIAVDRVLGRVTGGSVGSVQIVQNMISNNVVGNTKLADMEANTVKVRSAVDTGDPSNLAIAADRVLGRAGSGDLASIQIDTGHIVDGAVNAAKMDATGVTDGYVPTASTGAVVWTQKQSGHVIEENGVPVLINRANLSFNEGLVVEDDGVDTTTVRIGGAIYGEINPHLSDGDLASFTFGPTLSRPPANIENRYYFDTDTNLLYRDNESAWEQVTSTIEDNGVPVDINRTNLSFNQGLVVEDDGVDTTTVRIGGAIYGEINPHLTDGLLASFQFGPLADRPEPDVENRYWFDTDLKVFYRDQGSGLSWEQVTGELQGTTTYVFKSTGGVPGSGQFAITSTGGTDNLSDITEIRFNIDSADVDFTNALGNLRNGYVITFRKNSNAAVYGSFRVNGTPTNNVTYFTVPVIAGIGNNGILGTEPLEILALNIVAAPPPAATDSVAGIVELATSAETTPGLVVQASDTRLPTQDHKDAMVAANAPATGNPFATLADVSLAGSSTNKSASVLSPAASTVYPIFQTRDALVLQRIDIQLVGTTPAMDWTLYYGSNPNSVAEGTVDSGSTTAGTDQQTVFTTGTIPADKWVWVVFANPTGTIDAASVAVHHEAISIGSTETKTKSITIPAPANGEIWDLWSPSEAITITGVKYWCRGTTPSVPFNVGHGVNPTTLSNIDGTGWTASNTTSVISDTTLAAVSANAAIAVVITGAVTGTDPVLHVDISYTVD